MDSTKASTGCRTSWKMLIAKKKIRQTLFVFWLLLNMEWRKKTTTPKIIILLKIKIKKRIKKASSTTKDVYYYIPADQQKIACFFLLNKKFPFTFSVKQKQFSKIHFIIPLFRKIKNPHENFLPQSDKSCQFFWVLFSFLCMNYNALGINLFKKNSFCDLFNAKVMDFFLGINQCFKIEINISWLKWD